MTLTESELDIFGIADTIIAAEVLQSWNFPATICAAVQHYNSPADAGTEYQEISSLTQFAYYIANTSGIGNSGDEFSFDYDETFLVKQSGLFLDKECSAVEIAQEIQSTLREKVLAVTDEEEKTASPEPVAEKMANVQPVPEKKPAQKKGFWGWLSSLWTK